MTTRRDFFKGLFAASIMPASLSAFAKAYCGMDFGSEPSQTVWFRVGCHSLVTGGRLSDYRLNETVSIPWKRFNRQLDGCFYIPKVELEVGCGSPKTLHIKAKEVSPKTSKETKLDQLRWLLFEEASEFETKGESK